jgi:diaminopimelate epimerase
MKTAKEWWDTIEADYERENIDSADGAAAKAHAMKWFAAIQADARASAIEDATRVCLLAAEQVGQTHVTGAQNETLKQPVVSIAEMCGNGIRMLKSVES